MCRGSVPSTAAVRRLNSSFDTACGRQLLPAAGVQQNASGRGRPRPGARLPATNRVQTMKVKPNSSTGPPPCRAKKPSMRSPVRPPGRRRACGPGRRRFPRRNCPRRGWPRRGRSGCRPSATDSAASSTRNGRRWSPRCSLRIDTSARACRNAVVLSITIRLGCWPVVEEECNSRTTFSGGTAPSRKSLEHRHRQRRHVGRRAATASGVAAELVEEAAVGRAALGHARGRARAGSASARRPSRPASWRTAARESRRRLASRGGHRGVKRFLVHRGGIVRTVPCPPCRCRSSAARQELDVLGNLVVGQSLQAMACARRRRSVGPAGR